MINNKIDLIDIKRKNEIVDNAISVLKGEFVGIDKQIDEIMNNVRTWYLFPQLQSRPLVVSIWGMSGSGKTSLVKRISQLLNIEKDFVYWNFASISESSSWEIENQIEEELSNENSNRMFVYDEFQYAATINPSTHEERDNKSGLKPFWELLDSGLLHKRSDFWTIRMPYKILDYMFKINKVHEMNIENGVWTNAQECLSHFKPYDIQNFSQVFNFEYDSRKVKSNGSSVSENEDCSEAESCMPKYSGYQETDMPFFIKENYLEKLLQLHDNNSGRISDKMETYHKLEEMNAGEIIDFVVDVYENSRKGYDLRFNNSIIFVIGNLDEAYEMSFNVNPDMSPDQFRKITEKITVVDVKDALKNRFRNEQIARLGNIHVIYPSFSQKNFEELIDLVLDSYEKETFELTGYHLEFDDTIKKIIYDEGVYPTHGTRPIFSTVYEIVKSRLSEIIRGICENGCKDDVKRIVYFFDFDDDKVVVSCCDESGNELCCLKFNVELRLKKLRDTDTTDEEQALCALHESGHFVMYAKLFGKVPEKLVSRTTDSNVGGFLMEDIDEAKRKVSKHDLLNEIKVLLGGYVAEKYVFGDEMTVGASNDLSRATQLASRVVRRYGMWDFPYVTTNVEAENNDADGSLVREENQIYINREIKDIITKAENEVRQTFVHPEWRKMLKESSLYLCENSAMPKEKMTELYDNVADSVKDSVRNKTFYHDKIVNM